MTRNNDIDSSKSWSHKTGDVGFGGRTTSNFNNDPVGTSSLGSIGASHPHNSNDVKVDNNAYVNQLNFGPAGFFGNGNGNNPPPSSNFGAGINGPFGSLGGLGGGGGGGGSGGNGNGSGDANPLPPFPLLWGGGSGLTLKNVGGAPGLGGFQANSETVQSSVGEMPGDSGPGNWNGSVPRP